LHLNLVAKFENGDVDWGMGILHKQFRFYLRLQVDVKVKKLKNSF